jgi:hypothetical protein
VFSKLGSPRLHRNTHANHSTCQWLMHALHPSQQMIVDVLVVRISLVILEYPPCSGHVPIPILWHKSMVESQMHPFIGITNGNDLKNGCLVNVLSIRDDLLVPTIGIQMVFPPGDLPQHTNNILPNSWYNLIKLPGRDSPK